jgi:hypothetical protein
MAKAKKLLDLAAEGGEQLAKEIRDLLFVHNTDAQKLARQQAMGGMPNPSIAATQRDIPFEGFGDISLIGRPESFDPSLRQNPLFSADAYTVRAPSPVRVANKNAHKQFKSDYEAYRGSGNIDDVAYSLGDLESKSRIEPSDFRRVNDFLEYDNAAKLKFAQDNNIPVPKKENGDIDYYALSDVKSENADKYEQWRQGEISKYFQPEEYFVTNPDYDRYSGRAKLQPYTAENVSKWMSKRAGAGQESTMTFGAGNVRASTTERIKSLEQARQMKGQLKPAEDMAEFKQTSDMMLGDLQDALKDYYQYDTNSFSYFDSVGEMIALSEKKGLKRAMEEVGFKNVPDELVREIEGYKDYLRSAPTEYFESKPNRPVNLREFGGAIVPEDTPQGLIDQLQREGLQVEKYTDEADRVAKRGAFENLMFTRPETVVGAGLLGAGVLGSALAPQKAEASLVGIGSTIGRKAEDMLGMAQKMRDVGMSPKEIWEKTGWEFNEVDKRWRTEHPNYDNTKINMPQGEGVYPIRDVVNDPDLMSAYDNYDYQDRVAKFNEFPDQQSLLDYRRLAFNRGSLNDLAINITPELEAGDGALNGNYIDIGAGSTPDQFRDIVLHELQHAIQQRENFAAGSSPELFARVQGRQVMDELNDRPYELKKKAYEDVIGRASAYLDNPPSDATVGTMTEARNTLDEFTNRLRLLEQYNKDSLGGSRSAVNMYRATAGEVEARNVEKRDAPRRLTREYGPVESEDIIDRNQQIYLDSSGAPYFTPRDGELQPTIFKTGSTEKPLGLLGLGAFGAGAMAPEDAEAATGYKLFRQVDGKLYPLFVNRSTEVPMGEWLKAEAGELTPEGKVKSSLGPLAYRPGWHAGDLPIATHIGGKSGPVKAPNYRPNDQVWAEVEFPEDVDWQAIANANATRNKAGEIIPRTAQITDQVPYGGFYRYKTNPNMTGEWMIGGDMKVNRVLSDEEVQAINEASGVADLPRLQSIKDKTMLATPIAGAGLMAALAPDQVQAQELDPNLPLTIGSPKQEVNYETMPSYYDYGDGATIPVRPPEPVRETKPEYLPAGMPVNPYTFMMSQGATQGEAARAQAEAISEAGRGLANQVGGIGGEMETLGKGLLYAITGQSLGGSPFSRFMHVLNNYDPQLPNVKDVEQLPPVMPELYPLDEESRRIMNMFGGLISPL